MKVLVIPTWYPSGEDKLMGIYHKEFTEALNKYGIEADMLYIRRERFSRPLKYFFMKKRFIINEGNYKTYTQRMLNWRPISFDLQMKFYVKKVEKTFKDYLKTNQKPDVIHAMVSVPAGYAAVLIGQKYNIPVVVTEHGGNLERLYKKEPYSKYGLFVLKNAYMTTVSNYMKDIVLKYTDICEVLPNQVNTDLFKNNIERKITEPLKLISVCALREGKNIDTVFKAIKILEKEGVEVTYDIIGDGFFENYYKEKATSLNMGNKVRFLGRKTKKEISEYLKEYHALIISSNLESFSIPGIEALASGLPVITTDCLGPADFIDENTGITCKVDDPESMASAIKSLIKNYPQFNKNHLEEVADRFSEKSVISIAKNIYKKL